MFSRDLHDHPHVVLDQHDRDAEVPDAPDQRDQLERLGRVHPRRGLVEQEERRPRRQGARDLQPPLVPVGQVHRELGLVLADPEEVQQGLGPGHAAPSPRGRPGGCAAWRRTPGGRAAWVPTRTLSSDRHPPEEPDVLVRPGHAERGHLVRRKPLDRPPGEADGARRHREDARDEVEQRGLARAVRPDHGDQLAAGHREGHVVHRAEAAEALADAVDGQEALARRRAHVRDRARQELHAGRLGAGRGRRDVHHGGPPHRGPARSPPVARAS